MSSLQFLTFFVNTIAAVLDHQDLLCASMMSASNDHRLGANEAPPTIISVFIGDQLTKVLTIWNRCLRKTFSRRKDRFEIKRSG